jgi:transposase
MQEIVERAISTEPRISRNGKRLWSKAQKQLIVSEALKPGVSVSQVSRRYDVNANLIFRWVKAAEAKAGKKQKLIPVGIVSPLSVALSRQEQPTATSSPVTAAGRKLIEIDLRDGTKLRIDGDVRMPVLQSVLKLVRGLV